MYIKKDSSIYKRSFSGVSTYAIVSTVGFLSGVPQSYFRKDSLGLEMDCFVTLSKVKNARIIRNLCTIRTDFEQNFGKINERLRDDMKGIYDMPDLISIESLNELKEDGIVLGGANWRTDKYLVQINEALRDSIGNCKNLFPQWLRWDYVKSVFLMPDGTKPNGLKRAANAYHRNRNKYPYQVYINWKFNKDDSMNILSSDVVFVPALYNQHKEEFQELDKISTAPESTRRDIAEFVANHGRIAVLVDTENVDPRTFYSVLNNLRKRGLTRNLDKIILYWDDHASPVWVTIAAHESDLIKLDHVPRILPDKSLVDCTLTAAACRMNCKQHINSFVLVSSDSDYWGLISQLTDAQFLVLSEEAKCSHALREHMIKYEIPHCLIDEYDTSTASELVHETIQRAVEGEIGPDGPADEASLSEILERVYKSLHFDIGKSERDVIYLRLLKHYKLGARAAKASAWKHLHRRDERKADPA